MWSAAEQHRYGGWGGKCELQQGSPGMVDGTGGDKRHRMENGGAQLSTPSLAALSTSASPSPSLPPLPPSQGLAEVLSVLGTAHMEALLPGILEGCKHRAAHQREGHLTLFQFLPITLETLFQVRGGEGREPDYAA